MTGGSIRVVCVAALLSALVIPAATKGAVPTRRGVVYAGEIAQQFGLVSVEVNQARNRVTLLSFTWDADCTLGPAAPAGTPTSTGWTEYRANLPIGRRGRFGDAFVFRRRENGVQQQFTYKLAGVRSSSTVTGTLRVTLVEKDGAGGLIRTCPSPVLRYTATEKSVFSGLTIGQRNIALFRLNPAGTMIRRIRWNWDGTCTLGPGAKPDTSTTRFETDFVNGPISIGLRGTFRGNFTYDPYVDTSTGTTRTYRAKLVGRRVGSTLRGTLTAGFLETDNATGAVVRDCSSGPVKFNVKD